MKKIRLNFGCGSDIRDGYFNYDKYPVDGRVLKLDLDVLPLPFKDNYADEILMSHSYEHLLCNKSDFNDELHRILKPGGVFHVKMPTMMFRPGHVMPVNPRDYFHEIYFSRPLFSLVKFKRNKRRTLRNTLFKIRNVLELFLFEEFEWRFVKK